MPKDITCKHCGKVNQHHSFQCSLIRKPIKSSQSLERGSLPVVQKLKSKTYKPTGELVLFMKIYADKKGICEITGEQIAFDVNCFAHILSKGAYKSLRLNTDNIIMVKREIHHLYDNSTKAKLLESYPKAIIIYELKDKLRYNYYNS